MTVSWTLAASPVGDLMLLQGPRGLLRVAFGKVDPIVWTAQLESALRRPIRPVRDDRMAAARQLAEYFAGRRRHFDVRLDLGLVEGFCRRALQCLCAVRFGTVISYGELARRTGSPGAGRAVGRAMGKNPIPIVVPCHRVIAADGSLGGFSAGLSLKRRLHAVEGITLGRGAAPWA